MKKNKPAPEASKPPKPPAAPSAVQPWWPLPALLAAALAVYLPAMNGPFLFDDLSLPILGGRPPDEWTFYARRIIRAVFNLSLLADYHLWGLNPAPYHWLNWVLHAANGFLAFLILRGFKVSYRLSVLCAGIFWLHPLQTEAVSYIASRSEGLSVLFSYSALLLFVARDRQARLSWPRTLGILLLMGLGALSKESAVAMAGVFVIIDLLEGRLRRLLSNWKLYLPMAAGGAAAAYHFIGIASREGSAGFGLQGVKPLDYLWTQFQCIPIYLRFYVLPWGQNLDHGFPVAKAPLDFLSWVGLAFLATLTGLSWRYRAAYPLLLPGLLTFLVLLTPTSSIVPIADTLVERRMYLPFIGLLLATAALLERMAWNAARSAGAVAILALLAGLTGVRNQIYTSSIAMWQDSRAHFQLAYAFYREGQCAEANKYYEAAAALNKPDYELLVDWALSLDCAGSPQAAVEKLRAATALKKDSHAWATLGMVYGKSGRPAEALDALNQALAINRHDANALAYRGNVYLVGGRAAEAIADFEAALSISPANAIAAQGLAAARAAQSPAK
jgi:tetratricopeptide (TPR) repeat protein